MDERATQSTLSRQRYKPKQTCLCTPHSLVIYSRCDCLPLNMPLDNRKDDDNLTDASDYQVMPQPIIEDDDDFGFTDDDDADGGSNDEHEEFNFDRYDQYELLSQNPPENGGDGNEAQNGQYFTHNLVVEWIQTDEPLFNRAEFEARQNRHNAQPTAPNPGRPEPESNETTPHNADYAQESDKNETKINDSAPNKSTVEKSDTSQDKLETEKIDIIKNLMSNFKLPEENVPGWAKEISEDNWKNFLTKKLNP